MLRALTDFVSLCGIMVVRNSFTISGLCLLLGVLDKYFSVCVEVQRKLWAVCTLSRVSQSREGEDKC